MKNLVFRVDAGNKIGTGHLMRCLALAQAWKDRGGQATFVIACHSDNLRQRLEDEGFEIHLLPSVYPDDHGERDKTKNILAGYDGDWIVLDGYYFDEVYQQRIKKAGHRLLVIDDMAHLKHYYADIVLNQNLHAGQLHYSCEPNTRLLLGTKYVLLRREFLNYKNWKREIPEVAKRVLITLGGSDAKNRTSGVIKALQKVDISGLEATVVIGASNPHSDKLEATIKESRIPIRIIRHASNMPELMASADVAICSAGTTVWELAFMGTPTIVVATMPGEEVAADLLRGDLPFPILKCSDDGFEFYLIDAVKQLVADREARSKMSRTGQGMVNGGGCSIVVQMLLENN